MTYFFMNTCVEPCLQIGCPKSLSDIPQISLHGEVKIHHLGGIDLGVAMTST